METTDFKWYQKQIVVILLLFSVTPIGIYLMWKYELWNSTTRIAVSIALCVYLSITEWGVSFMWGIFVGCLAFIILILMKVQGDES